MHFYTALSLIIVLLLVSLVSTILPSQIEVQFLFGFCFCLASIGSMIIYFGLRSWMLLSGADLNGKFEVVWDKNSAPGMSEKTNAHCSSRNSRYVRNSKNDVPIPTTADECYKQINVLKKALAAILAFEANPLNNSPSFRISRGLDDVKKSGSRKGDESNRQCIQHNDDDDDEDEDERQHRQMKKVHTETSKVCPMSTSI